MSGQMGWALLIWDRCWGKADMSDLVGIYVGTEKDISSEIVPLARSVPAFNPLWSPQKS